MERQHRRIPGKPTDFQLDLENFPALPGSGQKEDPLSLAEEEGTAISSSASSSARMRLFDDDGAVTQKTGVQTRMDGTVTNIPEGMLKDQFGMVGLLTSLRSIDHDPSVVALALGQDLTTLGLNLNVPEKKLFETFGGPWSGGPCGTPHIDHHVPEEYLHDGVTRGKLPIPDIKAYLDDTLFFIFYHFVGDILQMNSAAELYNRKWRYHKEEKVWISRKGPESVLEQAGTYEKGLYKVFDALQWRTVERQMTVEYKKLEERPQLPPQLTPQPPPPTQPAPIGTGRGRGGAAGVSFSPSPLSPAKQPVPPMFQNSPERRGAGSAPPSLLSGRKP